MNNADQEIADEILKEEEARIMAEFAPKQIQRTQVKAAKFAWMFVAISIDVATAYIFGIATAWFYGVMWFLAGSFGLMFAEWLWERIGNNDEQTRIAALSKNVSAIAVVVMALLAGIAYILGWTHNQILEIIALVSAVSLFCFHGWQAYQYHEKDDDYIAATMDALADAKNTKEIRNIHRAGLRVKAKKMVRATGAKYEQQHGAAFTAAAGRTFGAETDKLSPPSGQSK